MMMCPSNVPDSDNSFKGGCWVKLPVLTWVQGGKQKKKKQTQCKWFFSPAGKTTVSLTREEEEEMKSAFLGSSEMRPVWLRAAIGPVFQTGRISEKEESGSSPEIELDSSGSRLRSKPDALPATQLLVLHACLRVCLHTFSGCKQAHASTIAHFETSSYKLGFRVRKSC